MATITFRFAAGDSEQVHEAKEGESILDIALLHDIDLQHNCGGVCGCSTCHIYVEKGMDSLPEIEDNEEDFIDRAVDPKINSRLACQCIISPDSEDIEVIIPPQDFLGH